MQDGVLSHKPKSLDQYHLWSIAGTSFNIEMRAMKNKKHPYREMVQKFKALAHPARLKLVENLIKQECFVVEIQKCLALPQPNVSQHLGVLKSAGIIEGRREKNKICYRISDKRIINIMKIFE
jgi:DNA-binding transcriptional ArsR family regulator